jgi:hypothetical protein
VRELTRLTEDDMIAAFVRAELHSERFGAAVRAAMRRHRVPRRVVEHPDTAEAVQNAQRLAVLRDYRRYGLDRSLFEGFPYEDVVWSRVALTRDEVLRIRYIDYDYWVELSGGTRLPEEAATRIRAGVDVFGVPSSGFLPLAEAVRQGSAFPELILVAKDEYSYLVVMEGNARLTAYFLAPEYIPDELGVLVGFSAAITNWGLY